MIYIFMGIGDWGLGIGGLGLVSREWGRSPHPKPLLNNPHSHIQNKKIK